MKRTLISAMIIAATLPVAAAARKDSPTDASTFTVVFENDLFAGTDDLYTNGVQIGWLSPDLKTYEDENRLPRWILPLVHKLPFINVVDAQHNVGFTIGQQIFTPADTQSRTVVANDRPYAGWLYGGLAFISKNEHVLDTIEVQFGVVGPWSLAEDAQKLIHDLRGFDSPKGWGNQLDNEPGLNVIYQNKLRLLRSTNPTGLGYDVITHAGGSVGNVSTYLNAGGEVRFGWNLPGDYGTAIIRAGGDANAPTSVSDPRLKRGRDSLGIYFFGGISGRWVLHDIFLDGNSFIDSHSVDKENLVGDALVGAAVEFGSFKLSYTQNLRSREFRGQQSLHNFGSMSLSYTF